MKKEWKVKKLGEVCEIVNGSTPLRTNKDFWDNGDFPWFTINDIREQGRIIRHTKQQVTQAALQKLRVLPENSVLLCCTASIGEYAITEINLTTNQQFNGLIVKNKNELSPLFLFYFSSTLKGKLSNLSGKTTIDFIPISRLKEIEIPIPPISEQQCIVAILDKAFDTITRVKENAEKNLQNAREIFESYFQSIFANQGNGWKRIRIEDVCESIIDCVNKTASIVEEPTPFKMIRTTNVRDGKVNLNSVNYVTENIFNIWTRRQVPMRGDVILTREAPLGEVGMLLTDDHVFLGQRLVSYRANVSKLDNRFLLYAFQSNDVQRQIQALASGSTVQHMRVPDSKALQLYLPSLHEQHSIVAKLDALSTETKKLEAIYKQKLADFEELKKSILQKAFNGEL